MKVIHIAAALITRSNGDVLLVRKRGTAFFMQPGGKIEPGETPSAALSRELLEEIGISVPADTMRALGQFDAPAANEPDHLVRAELFAVPADLDEIAPKAEIEEIRWIDPARPHSIAMAELTEKHILPFYRQMRSIPK